MIKRNKFLSLTLSLVMGLQGLLTPASQSMASSLNVNSPDPLLDTAKIQEEIDNLRESGQDPTLSGKDQVKSNEASSMMEAVAAADDSVPDGRAKGPNNPMKVTFLDENGSDYGKVKCITSLNDTNTVVTGYEIGGKVKFENAYFKSGDKFLLKNIPTQKDKLASSEEPLFELIPQEEKDLVAQVKDSATGKVETRTIGKYKVNYFDYEIELNEQVEDLREITLYFGYKGKINITGFGEWRDLNTTHLIDTVAAFVYKPVSVQQANYEAKDEDRGDYSWRIHLNNLNYPLLPSSGMSQNENQSVWNTTKKEMVQMMVRFRPGADKSKQIFYIKPPQIMGNFKTPADDPHIGREKTASWMGDMDMYVSIPMFGGTKPLAGVNETYNTVRFIDPKYTDHDTRAELFSKNPSDKKPFTFEEIKKNELYKVTIDPNHFYDVDKLDPAKDLAYLDAYFTIYAKPGEEVKLQSDVDNAVMGMSEADKAAYIKKYSFGYKVVDENDKPLWGGKTNAFVEDDFRYWAPIKFTEANAGGSGDINSDAVVTPGDPKIELTKTADKKTVSKAGEVINYTITITNTGDVVLYDVDLVDDYVPNDDRGTVSFKREDGKAINITNGSPTTTLKPGESVTVNYSHTVTDEEIKHKYLDNTAYTKGNDKEDGSGQTVTDEDSHQIDVTPGEDPKPTPDPEPEPKPDPGKPHIKVEKTADKKTVSKAGDVITYTVKITNDGNRDLHDVDLFDHLVINSDRSKVVFKRADGREIKLSKTDLAIGETITATYEYKVTKKDLEYKHLDNTVYTKGKDKDGTVVEDNDDFNIDVIKPGKPSITVEKKANKTKVTKAGEVITYTVIITNNGKVTLHEVDLFDHLVINSDRSKVVFRRADGREIKLDKTDLEPGESITATYEYKVTKKDIENKYIDNAVFTKGKDDNGETVKDRDEFKIDVVKPDSPHLKVRKKANTKKVSKLGEVIKYTVEITNDGEKDLKDLNLLDHLVINNDRDKVKFSKKDGKEIKLTKTDLAVGETIIATYEHKVTKEDLAKKHIDNAVFAKAKDKDGNIVEANDKWEIDVVKPGLKLTKTGDKKEVSKAGDVINYTVVITNDGNQDIKDLNLKDKLEAVDAKNVEIKKDGARVIKLDKVELKAGESMTVKYKYTVTKKDLTKKFLKNLAFVVGKAANGEVLTAEDDYIVKITKMPETGVNDKKDSVSPAIIIFGSIILIMLLTWGIVTLYKKYKGNR